MRKRLAEEDAAAIQNKEMDVIHQNVTPSAFILQGIEIEATQYAAFVFLCFCRGDDGPATDAV